jgi:NAD(P)-dependent dehydrogenase (short-subunit alcohol dehydrogenase family)
VHKDVPTANVVFIEADLASLSSVKAGADAFLAQSDRLDILICNAGIMAVPKGLTKDGYEIQFGTNHMGHALFIKKFLPLLLASAATPNGDARIVILTSLGFQLHPTPAGILFDTLKTPQDLGMAGTWKRYGQSKLANVLTARELARLYPQLTSVAIHPGVVGTDLVGKLGWANKLLVTVANPRGLLTPVQGAYNQVWAATVEKSKLKNGAWYEPVGQPGSRDTSRSKDDELAKRLWEWTEKELAAY